MGLTLPLGYSTNTCTPSTSRKPLATAEPVSPLVATSTLTSPLPSAPPALFEKCASILAMKRAPTSLNASVGPWNSSNAQMSPPTLTTGQSKASVSQTILCRSSVAMSSPKKFSATRQAICWNVMPCMFSKKSCGSGFICSGIYRPRSGASPVVTASARLVGWVWWLVL